MIAIGALRAAAVGDRFAALRAELGSWVKRTARGQGMEKHNTQVARLTQMILPFLDKVAPPDPQAASAAASNAAAGRALAAGRLWAFFRSKLALREVDLFASELRCADELAWECYHPARDAAVAAGTVQLVERKEPPLVYFTSDDSPSARSRGDAFNPEASTQSDADLLGIDLLRLPIPLVGVPWLQRGHLPTLATIAHEVGHAVEHDCKLRAALADSFATMAVSADQRPAWQAWRREIFADAYGVLCLGRAAALALTEYLADDPGRVQAERRSSNDWTTYPTATLRVLLNCALLEHLGLADGGLRQRWLEAYPVREASMRDFEGSLAAVARAVYDTPLAPFGGRCLPDIVRFDQADEESVDAYVARIVKGQRLSEGASLRRLFAAASIAYYSDPVAYAERGAHEALLKRIVKTIPMGVRGADGTMSASNQEAVANADAALAEELLARPV